MSKKVNRRDKIRLKIRSKLSGTSNKPRLSVFRSNIEIYAQLIDDLTGTTLASATSYKNKDIEKGNKVAQATVVGKLVAEKAKAAGVEVVVFDRNGYLYHGRVKALANSAREGGLKF